MLESIKCPRCGGELDLDPPHPWASRGKRMGESLIAEVVAAIASWIVAVPLIALFIWRSIVGS